MGDGDKDQGGTQTLSVDIEQLKDNAKQLRGLTLGAAAGIGSVATSIDAGITALGDLSQTLMLNGYGMERQWNDADAALRDRLLATADRIDAAAQLYSNTDAANASKLAPSSSAGER